MYGGGYDCYLLILGVGWAMITVSLIVCIYYNVIMSYTVYYMYSSFASEVPWSKCDPEWADMATCYVRGEPPVGVSKIIILNYFFIDVRLISICSVFIYQYKYNVIDRLFKIEKHKTY